MQAHPHQDGAEGYLFCLKLWAESQPAESLATTGRNLGVWRRLLGLDNDLRTPLIEPENAAMLGFIGPEEMIEK